MFPEVKYFPDRYEAAAKAGFSAVEVWELYDYSLCELVDVQTKAGVQQLMMGSYLGEKAEGEFGLASLPDRKEEFDTTLDLGIQYCKAMNCKMFHVTAGNCVGNVPSDIADKTYKENLAEAAQILAKEDIVTIIEPISATMRPSYYLTNVDKALDIIKEINNPYLRLELDLFHLQLMSGNLTNKIKEALPWIGHIQIAQVPNRQEPDVDGELNWRYIFNLLEHLGYDKWIGCEYIPKGNTEDGLKWIKDFGYQL